MLQAADTACYAAKDAGRNRVHVWIDSDAALLARQGEARQVSRLEQALDDDRFLLYAQRIVRTDGQVEDLHCEVLLRLREADGTIVAPGAFLPAAERFHMVSRIDRWVVRRVCEWLARLHAQQVPVTTVAVNLSGQSIGDRAFHAFVRETLARSRFDMRQLCFEITETTAITHLADATAFIHEMRAAGVRVALDDFGAGASSFGYLKALPVDFVKIDGKFVRDMLDDPLDAAAVRCFSDVARILGVPTVAEFVEREDTRAELQRIGVQYCQGYLAHRPEPLDGLLDRFSTVGAQAVPAYSIDDMRSAQAA
jgi:EAL domain-containing protein (putative c-di-GMP-specific phosphodiesterase class I)